VDLEPGLLIGFGNQIWVLFEGVGFVVLRSAARGPQTFDTKAVLEAGDFV